MSRYIACVLALLAATSLAAASSPFENVMRAQYAARQVPHPISAEEAERIYQAYLRSIGQATAQNSSTNSGGSAGTPSR